MNVGMYSNIPLELRLLKQWVCWREGKVPYQINGQLADVTNPATWNTFDACVAALANPLNLGVGFVFIADDPYAFIDLDNALGDAAILATHLKIAHEFNSYSEVSPSGMGLHIIIKGKVLAGRRRSKVEIYSSQRYATMTGNVHNRATINDCQEQLTMLWDQMGSGPVAQSLYKGDDKELYLDSEIIKRATEAVNGDKFLKLYDGRWREVFPHIPLDQGPSEADFALIDIIAFYTQNRNQIERIFYTSALGKRDKIKRKDYLPRIINRSFDHMLPPLDFDGLKNALENKLARDQLSLPLAVSDNGSPAAFDAVSLGSNPNTVSNPPVGLLGEIASFIYQAAPRPVPEVALAAAIGLMAGVCGRAYNVSGTGLNQYVLLLAMTGTGKEASAEGIDKLMATIKMQVPTSTGFIGPGEIPSGTGLLRHLANNSQSFVSLIGEFGLKLQQISSHNASSSDVSLRRLILDLYNKSGANRSMPASAYAKKEDSINSIPSPAFSLIGESTPERFYGALTEDMISEGLLPRFLLIDYKGDRPSSNKNHSSVVPSFSLIEKFAALCAQCESINHSNPRRVINVQFTDEAQAISDDFDKYADGRIRGAKEIVRQLWNRAHIKVLKLSALLAVGENMIEPTINPVHFNWAVDLVQADIRALTNKFEAGEIGASSHEIKQAQEVIRVIKDYITFSYDKVEKYLQVKSQKLHNDKVIPYVYLNKRLAAASVFRLDRAGGTVAIKRAIQNLVDSDRISELGKIWANEKYGTSQRCFVVKDLSILDDI